MMICNNFIIIIILLHGANCSYRLFLCCLFSVCFNIILSVWVIFITELLRCNRQFSNVQWENILGPEWLFICNVPWQVALSNGKGNSTQCQVMICFVTSLFDISLFSCVE
jgi:hypothetical protein